MKTKITARMIAEKFQSKGIKLICGKWFNKSMFEIKDIEKYILTSCDEIQTTTMLNEVIDLLTILTNDPTGKYPPMPIIAEAKALKELKPLAFELNAKQLMLINYLLRHDEELFIIITGVGGSGKSTYLNIIKQVFDNDYACLNLSQLSSEYTLATGVGKRLIYSDELNSDDLNNGQLKALFSNQPVTVNPKYKQPFQTVFQSAFIFSCNKAPKLDISDSGMMRRILYYEMNQKITNPNPAIARRIYTHDELVNIVAHALRLDMANWKSYFKDETRKLLLCNNSVYKFKTLDYLSYCDACMLVRLKPFSEPRWLEIHAVIDEWEAEEALPDVSK